MPRQERCPISYKPVQNDSFHPRFSLVNKPSTTLTRRTRHGGISAQLEPEKKLFASQAGPGTCIPLAMGRPNLDSMAVSQRPAILSPTTGSVSPGGAAKQPSSPFIFITSTNAKPDAASRRSIRSHVMRGKNRKRPSDKTGVQLGSWINNTGSTSLAPSADLGHVPKSMGCDLKCFPFVQELTSPMLDLVFQFFTVIKQTVYPAEICVDFDQSQWVEYLVTDAIFLYSTLFTTKAFFDYLRQGAFGPDTMKYLGVSLALLRDKLADSDAQPSNGTIASVVSLALMADKLGDVDSAEKHVRGLSQMVNLRGGIESFQSNPQLQLKICRADLGFALSSGWKPLFFQRDISWNPYVAARNLTTKTSIHKLHPSTPDQRLVNIWLDLEELSRSTNLAFQTGRKMRGELFQEALISAQYRLLALGAEKHYNSPLVERMAKMGMLAFSTVTFLQMQGIPMYIEDFATKLRRLLDSLASSSSHSVLCPKTTAQENQGPRPTTPRSGDTEAFLKLKLWLLFMGYISVLDQSKHQEFVASCVSDTMKNLGLSTWPAVRDVLMAHMWVDWTHKAKGKALVEIILAKQAQDNVCKSR
ncbi:hypothetical protein B0T18DRAFT_207136 [Schizothecium vesticola]|uniref:Uncharacterized protein n=1 Tax=Schizothecium vesticola TaxID=314040 RepID=A0AA40JYR7_9PEZI|nr:hypothetical protein B0T18DRAFT_207136 [Schizothecium vesticola]